MIILMRAISVVACGAVAAAVGVVGLTLLVLLVGWPRIGALSIADLVGAWRSSGTMTVASCALIGMLLRLQHILSRQRLPGAVN